MANWKIRSKIEPAFDGALLDNDFVQAGLFIRKTKAQRNGIKAFYRKMDSSTTTLCLVEADSIIYRLTTNPTGDTTADSDWTPLNLQSNALTPVGNWDKDNTAPILTDAAASGRQGEFYFVTDAPTATVVTHAGLFGGQPVTVSNGMYIVSVGSSWIVVSNATTWDAIAKPSVIVDYVNGIVIAHSHAMSDITGLAIALSNKFDTSNVADHTIPFGLVPDEDIVDVAFLREHYYTSDEIDTIIDGITSGGGSGVDVVDVDTSPSTIILDFNANSIMVFNGVTPFSTTKTLSIINASLGVKFDFIFGVSNLTAKINVSGFIMADARVTSSLWEASDIGKFKATGTYDGTNWWLDISSSTYNLIT